MRMTDEEKDLIALIRNYRNAYPNGEAQLRYEIYRTLEELMEVHK